MKKIALIILGTALLFSCGETTKDTKSTEKETIETSTKEYFGDTISTDGAIDMNALTAMLATNDSAIVTLTGEINAVCQKKGCWMTMPMNDSVDMRVRFVDYGFFVPLNCENRKATIQGVAKRDVITVAMLKHYAEDAEESQEEIDKITEPETEYSFLATGVVLD